MWTRIKHSLTLRIFLMTCGLMIAVCAATYGAIAYLTPLTYTSILQEDLDQKTEALLTALSGREPSACDELLSAFCRETGAALRLSDEYGRILYDTISSEAYLVEGTAERAAITTEESETLEQDAVMQATEAGDATGTAESVIHQITVTDAYISADEARTFFFRDRTMGYLLVVGGKKAVNQASEAMKKTLPFLVLLILGVSLLTSFFYTRWITRPIVDISHIAARIAGLDFSSRWAQHRTDEIGALGDSLNTLSDNLSGALTELKAANERLQQDMERERDMERQRSAFFSAEALFRGGLPCAENAGDDPKGTDERYAGANRRISGSGQVPGTGASGDRQDGKPHQGDSDHQPNRGRQLCPQNGYGQSERDDGTAAGAG